MSNLSCLTSIVGLSNIDCDCVLTDRPIDYSTSTSGYFLTDLKYGVSLKQAVFASSDCFGGKNVWEILTEARRLAILDFERDLISYIYETKEARLNAYSGLIGQKRATTTMPITGKYIGVELDAKNYKGGFLTLKGGSIGLSQTSTFDVVVINQYGEEHGRKTVAANGGQFNDFTFDTEIKLPLETIEGEEDTKYKIYYEIPTGASVLTNKFWCCGRSPKWTQFLKASGFQTDDLDSFSNTSIPYGITLDVTLNCDSVSWVCDIHDIGGYQATSVIARAIQFRAASYAISAVIDTNNINFFTLLNKESLYGKRNHLDKEYNEYTQFVSENIPSGVTDCFVCAEDKKIIRRASLA